MAFTTASRVSARPQTPQIDETELTTALETALEDFINTQDSALKRIVRDKLSTQGLDTSNERKVTNFTSNTVWHSDEMKLARQSMRDEVSRVVLELLEGNSGDINVQDIETRAEQMFQTEITRMALRIALEISGGNGRAPKEKPGNGTFRTHIGVYKPKGQYYICGSNTILLVRNIPEWIEDARTSLNKAGTQIEVRATGEKSESGKYTIVELVRIISDEELAKEREAKASSKVT